MSARTLPRLSSVSRLYGFLLARRDVSAWANTPAVDRDRGRPVAGGRRVYPVIGIGACKLGCCWFIAHWLAAGPGSRSQMAWLEMDTR